MGLRYAFDIGTNSIGWAVYRLAEGKPQSLIDCGVRIFSDGRNPKDGQSLAAMRRVPRSARRRRDRFLQRRDWLMQLLVRHGLMPAEEKDRKALESLDPYALRARALDERLSPHEVGRALFHLNQRRGFKSNRIADSKADDDKEKGKIAEGAVRLKERLAAGNYRTLGQYYASLQKGPVRQRNAVRVRIRGEGAKAAYDFYPVRELLEEEFDTLWAAQASHHLELMTKEARRLIRQAIFHQRPLKPPKPGRCTFNPSEERLAVADPLAQAFRIYQELANIEIEEGLNRPRKLTLDERDRLAERLLAGEELTFGKVRKALGLGGAAKINLEEGGRDRLKGDETAARLGGPKGRLKRLWPALSVERRAVVIRKLLDETDARSLEASLVDDIGATPEEAAAAAGFRPPDGHIRLGRTACAAIVAELKAGDPASGFTIPYSAACERAGFHHSDLRTGEVFDRLPDYREVLERHTAGGTGDPADGRDRQLGRVPNPTVHIGLNQLRRVINALIEAHGHPDQIVLELARELKQTREDKDRAQKENRKNEEANRRRAADLEDAGLAASPSNLRLMRLWEDLGPLPRQCTYTGRPISFTDLFRSGEVEIEHILPFSRTLDDSMVNKTVAYREANRGKRNLAPEEADWSSVAGGYEGVQQRASALPRNKAWRFKPGAMERYEAENRDFLARQLNETRYLSRLAREYVSGVANRDPGRENVWVVTGRLTALLRARWGLNFSNVKDRNNHRHHAIDAAAIGVIDRGLLAELSRRAGRREADDLLDDITRDVPEPYPGFREEVRDKVSRIVVSHKAEHGTGGALHEDTAYGLVDPQRGEDGNLVYRKAIDTLKPGEIDRVRDLTLRARLQALVAETGGPKGDAKALAAKLREFGEANRVRRVRLLKQEEGVVVLKDQRTGRPYKALIPGENHHMDIVEGPDGAWSGYAATIFEVNRSGFRPRWMDVNGARRAMRLHKGDLIELEDADGVRRIKRVVRINPSGGRLYLAAHDEAGELAKRHDDPDDPFRWDLASISRLKDRGCRLVQVGPNGR